MADHAGAAMTHPPVEELPESMQRLIKSVEATDDLSPLKAKELMEAADISVADCRPFSAFGHSRADSYGRNLIYDAGFFEIIVMSWDEGDYAAIHDHGYTQWGAVKMFGPGEHATFSIDDGVLTTHSRAACKPGIVLPVDNELIHQMGNYGVTPYMSLHMYGAYDRNECVTADARIFDLDEDKIQITTGGAFFALPEECITRREDCPPADMPTTLRHNVELLTRLFMSNPALVEDIYEDDRADRLVDFLFEQETWKKLQDELAEVLESSDEKKKRRYINILNMEARAAASMQDKLIRAGFAPDEFEEAGERLARLFDIPNANEFAGPYLEFIGGIHRLKFATV